MVATGPDWSLSPLYLWLRPVPTGRNHPSNGNNVIHTEKYDSDDDNDDHDEEDADDAKDKEGKDDDNENHDAEDATDANDEENKYDDNKAIVLRF